MEAILKQVNQEIKDIFIHNIETTNAYVVPSRNDANLTFPIGDTKKGKVIKTCVLMVDIRDSTKISKQLSKDKAKLGKIYSAFIHAMTTIADEYGYVRNIIGDRIMVVFDPKDCFGNALTCALLMNTVSTRILAKYVGLDTFKVGIGIDYGEMLVLKTGIRKKHEEQSEYKNLVWVGDAANIASKITDCANKVVKVQNYKVKYQPYNYGKLLRIQTLASFLSSKEDLESSYLTTREEILAEEEIINKISVNSAKTGFNLNLGKVQSIEKMPAESISIPNILMTENVYTGLKQNHPERIYESYNPTSTRHIPIYKEVKYRFKDVTFKVYGADRYYPVVNKIIN
jgi:adenylate cyclase